MERFCDLINRLDWEEARSRLLKEYPDQENSLEGYALVFHQLQSMAPTENDTCLHLEKVTDDFGDGEEQYVDVYGTDGALRDDGQEEHFAIEYQPWSEWLGMSIAPTTLQRFSEPQIAAHCLYEMTFAGFDEETIQTQIEEIRRRADELDSMTPEEREKHLISAEDFMARLQDGFGDEEGSEGDPR